MSINIENLITVKKVMSMTGYSRSTVYRWMKKKINPLPYYQPSGPGGRRMFDLDQLNRWFRKQQVGVNRGNQFSKN